MTASPHCEAVGIAAVQPGAKTASLTPGHKSKQSRIVSASLSVVSLRLQPHWPGESLRGSAGQASPQRASTASPSASPSQVVAELIVELPAAAQQEGSSNWHAPEGMQHGCGVV